MYRAKLLSGDMANPNLISLTDHTIADHRGEICYGELISLTDHTIKMKNQKTRLDACGRAESKLQKCAIKSKPVHILKFSYSTNTQCAQKYFEDEKCFEYIFETEKLQKQFSTFIYWKYFSFSETHFRQNWRVEHKNVMRV